MPQHLIKFRPAQEEAFLCPLGMLFLIWRRQFGMVGLSAAMALVVAWRQRRQLVSLRPGGTA